MTKSLYSVLDLRSSIFANPFISVNDMTALRDFGNAVNDLGTTLSKNPEDFQLYKIGSFDDVLGVITPCDRQLLANANTLVEVR